MRRQPHLPEHILWGEPGGRKGAVGEEMPEGTARCAQERKDSCTVRLGFGQSVRKSYLPRNLQRARKPGSDSEIGQQGIVFSL